MRSADQNSEGGSRSKYGKSRAFVSKYGIVIAFVIFCLILSISTKGRFLVIDNVLNVLRQVSINGVLAIGMTFVILTGGIDLSVGAVVALMEELADQAGLSETLLEPVVKTVALSILTRLTAEICRSAGEGGVAAFVETAGTVLALLAALPLVRAVAQLMGELLI